MSQQSEKRAGNGARKGAESFDIKVGLAEMLKGGVIMDVTTPEQAKVAEEAGAAAVEVLRSAVDWPCGNPQTRSGASRYQAVQCHADGGR